MTVTQSSDRDIDAESSSFTADLHLHITVIVISLVTWMLFGMYLCTFIGRLPLLREFETVELRDRISVAIVAGLIPILAKFGISSIRSTRRSTLNKVAAWVSSSVLFLSLSWTTYYGDTKEIVWSGFGVEIGLIALAIVAFLFVIPVGRADLDRIGAKQFLSTVQPFVWAIVLGFYLPSVLQQPTGVIYANDARHPLNEYISAVTGNYLLGSYTPRYSALLTWPLAIFRNLASTDSIIAITFAWVNLLIVLQFLVMGKLVKRIFPSLPFGICIAIPVVLSLVKGQPNERPLGSIAVLMSAIPGRTLLPIVLLYVFTIWATSESRPARSFGVIGTGIVAVFTVVNNFEFGSTALLALAVSIVLGWRFYPQQISKRETLLFCLSGSITFGLVVLGFRLMGHPLDMWKVIAFTRVFGKQGFGSIAMPTFGLFIMIFALLGSSASLGIRRLTNASRLTNLPKDLLSGTIVAMYIGVWGTLSLLYYAGRSTNSGQLQIFLIPLSLAICAILKIAGNGHNESSHSHTFADFLRIKSPTSFLLFAIPIVSLAQIPDPAYEWNRFFRGDRWSVEIILESDVGKAINTFAVGKDRNTLYYFGVNPNLTQLATGLKSVLGVNHPSDLWVSPTIQALGCEPIARLKPMVVLVPTDDLPEIEMNRLCQQEGLVHVGPNYNGVLQIYTFRSVDESLTNP